MRRGQSTACDSELVEDQNSSCFCSNSPHNGYKYASRNSDGLRFSVCARFKHF